MQALAARRPAAGSGSPTRRSTRWLARCRGLQRRRAPRGRNVRSDYVNGVNPSDGILYSVRTFDQDTSLRTKKGWDDVTGVGTPTAIYPQVFADS